MLLLTGLFFLAATAAAQDTAPTLAPPLTTPVVLIGGEPVPINPYDNAAAWPPLPEGPCALDVCVCVDESGSIGTSGWADIIDLLIDMVRFTSFYEYDVKYGIVTFGDVAECDLPLTSNPATVLAKIRGSLSTYGGYFQSSNMADGLKKCRENVFGGGADNPNIPNMVVLISDGVPNNLFAAGLEANALKLDPPPPATRILTVGVGNPTGAALAFLSSISSYGVTVDVNDVTLLSTFVHQIIEYACPQLCPLDLCFVVDRSGSIDADQFNHEVVPFLQHVVNALALSPIATQVSIVAFATEAILEIEPTLNLPGAISNIPIEVKYINGGSTNMADALEICRTVSFGNTYDLPNYENVVVLISDGEPNFPVSDSETQIDLLVSNEDARICTLAIGDFDKTFLDDAATDGKTLNVPNPKHLYNYITKLLHKLCPDYCKFGCNGVDWLYRPKPIYSYDGVWSTLQSAVLPPPPPPPTLTPLPF